MSVPDPDQCEIAEATADVRAAGKDSVCFYDNLGGQTTAEHKRLLNKYAKCSRHLLPTNSGVDE